MRATIHPQGREAGAVFVLYAMALVAMFSVAALVLDLGQLRVDRRSNKAVADFAVRAGVARLQFSPWDGVCKARDYLLRNATGFSAFDAGSETWSNAATPSTGYATSPCASTATAPFTSRCSPQAPASWARLAATAAAGRFTIEIQSGYTLPDARFPEDTALSADTGDSQQGSCDNVSVIITQRRSPFLAQIMGAGDRTTRVRSVGRLNSTETLDYVAALLLLEQRKCNVLQTGGTGTRVVAQPTGTHPGIIQIDSAGDDTNCPQPILNAQATSGGPSVVACSANSTSPDCTPGIGSRKSRVGIYALNFARPASDVATPYPTTYGDTQAIHSPRAGRRQADRRYRTNLRDLDASTKTTLTGNSGRPPGCAAVANNACTGNGVTWLVLQQADCDNQAAFFAVAGRTAAPNIWFNCDLTVTTALTLGAPRSSIAVTGQLTVRSVFSVSDPRSVLIGGRSTGNKVGVDVGGTGSEFNVNLASETRCSNRSGPGRPNVMVIANGSFNVTSGATVRLCQTFAYLASGYDKMPAADGTPPCTTPCSGYSGTLNIASGSFVDWSAINEIADRPTEPGELATTNRYEDLALWTEAGGNANGVNGGSSTRLTGVYFLGNADSFNLAGNGALPITLSAQFVATSMKVSGGALVNLVPNPTDSVAVLVYSTLLVR